MEDFGPSDQNGPVDSRWAVRLNYQFYLQRAHLSPVRESHYNSRPIKRRKPTRVAFLDGLSHGGYVGQGPVPQLRLDLLILQVHHNRRHSKRSSRAPQGVSFPHFS
jgi:hypothetical protein